MLRQIRVDAVICKAAQLLGAMRRDERLDKLHDGLSVLRELWQEAEGGS